MYVNDFLEYNVILLHINNYAWYLHLNTSKWNLILGKQNADSGIFVGNMLYKNPTILLITEFRIII